MPKKIASGTSRRRILRGAAVLAGAAIGSGAVRGFPTLWAQNIKDITLNHVGGPWAVIKEIGLQASKDLGFTVVMQPTDIPSEIQRALTQPKSIDIFQSEETTNKYLEHAGVLKPIHVKDYKLWDKTLSMYTEGKFPDGRPIPNIGMSPMKAGFWTGPDAKKLAGHPTDWLVMLPTLFNADTLGIRPDLVGGEDKVTSWGDLLEPKYKGKSSLCSLAIVGVTDAAMALQARGEIKYGDIGNMTRAEIDKTFEIMNKIKQSGFFRAFWGSFDESVNLMAAGEVVIQSMISPAVTAVKARGIPCYYAPLKEGYRAWTNGLALMRHLSGIKRDAAYDYINWYQSGWVGGFIAKQGYYVGVPETAKKFLSDDEWGYWYEGKPAKSDIKDPYGKEMEKAGAVRDGGSYEARFSKIACWNTLMDEA